MTRLVGIIGVGLGLLAGCAGVPKNESARSALDQSAQATVQRMTATDPSIRPLMDQSAAYLVFPEIKQAGLVVGGAGGPGIVYQDGRAIAFAELRQGSVGAQVGVQKYSELIVVQQPFTLEQMKAGNFDLGAQASAVVLRAGAATQTRFGPNGLAVFVKPIRGAMVNASVTGQTIKITQ